MRINSLEVRLQRACIAFKRTVGSVLCELVGPRIRNQRKCVAVTPARRRAMSRARERVYAGGRARARLGVEALVLEVGEVEHPLPPGQVSSDSESDSETKPVVTRKPSQ